MTDLVQTKRRQLLKGAGVLSALGALTALGQPISLATPGHGSWKRTGERTFLLTYLTLNHDTNGTFQGTSKIRQVATLNQTGTAYSGSGNFDVYDVHGNVILSGTFTIRATRIRVETPS